MEPNSLDKVVSQATKSLESIQQIGKAKDEEI